jgi:hypothetical protein
MALVTTTGEASARMGVRRLGWGLADQALSSLTNFALAVMVARTVSTGGLGAFGLAFTTYTVTLGACRAICSEPLSVRYSAVAPDDWTDGTRTSTGTAIVLGVLAGTGCVGAGFALAGALKMPLIALGACMPGLIVQDTWRSAFFCQMRGSRAFLNDFVWGVAQFTLVGAVLISDHRSTPWFVLAWGVAANVAAIAGCVQAGLLPSPLHTVRWLSRQRDLAPRYLVEFVARNAAQSGAMYSTAAFAGLAAAGALRGAQVALGPLNILNMGITAPAITEAVRLQRRSPRRMLHMVGLLGVVLVTMFTAWGVAMYFLPASIGHILLKKSWEPAHSVVLAYTAVMAASGMLTAATVGLRAMAAAKRSLRARIVTGILAVSGGTFGAATAGAEGAAIGLAAGLWLGGIQWWIQLFQAVAERERESSLAAAGEATRGSPAVGSPAAEAGIVVPTGNPARVVIPRLVSVESPTLLRRAGWAVSLVGLAVGTSAAAGSILGLAYVWPHQPGWFLGVDVALGAGGGVLGALVVARRCDV